MLSGVTHGGGPPVRTKFTHMKYVNLTPHVVNLNDGRSFPSEGSVRIEQEHGEFVGDICKAPLGDLTGLPEPKEGVKYIVSMPVLMAAAAKGMDRDDLVAPATNHPECKRNEKGWILSVPGFITL